MYHFLFSLVTGVIVAGINCALQLYLQRYRTLEVRPLYDVVHEHFVIPEKMMWRASLFCNTWPYTVCLLVFLLIQRDELVCTSLSLILVMTIRALCCLATTLPLIKRTNRRLALQVIIGGNGDLYVSGHSAFALMLGLVLYKNYPLLSVACTLITVAFFGPLLVLMRHHYTNDVLVAIFVVCSVMHLHNSCLCLTS